MSSLNHEIESIHQNFLDDINQVKDSDCLEKIKIKYLGKKGLVASLMPLLKNATKEERPLLGKLINDLKVKLETQLDSVKKKLFEEELTESLKKEKIDVSLPGRKNFMGRKHPLSLMTDELFQILNQLGFSIQTGPHIESDFYNFEALNFAKDHPARDMQDTFYLSSELLLRTHTSNVQIRVMESHNMPIRVAAFGRCFRNETVSSRSTVMFNQVEGFYIDKKVTFADLMCTLDEFWKKLFQKEVKTRYRPSYFPFVEPGMEGDIECTLCNGKGCKICKNTGWLEVIGAGMIHPEVLKAGGIDPEKYSGYAFGGGIDRLALLKYGVDNIRLFFENDIRFLEQFS
jgi:phenylalanyl-tRNA synthetase alpha chain